MSIKRKREDEDAGPESAKQARTERPAIDSELVELYDRLADEKESRRLKAASKLLKKLQSNSSDSNQITTALKRLFRGLCSGRKAARQGFSVALTELLSQLGSSKVNVSLVSNALIDIWVNATSPESGVTKQEEREHFLGRIFGADAIIKSRVLIARNEQESWKHLLNVLCEISQKKPWLRQECGWMLYHFCSTTIDTSLQSFVEDVVDVLSVQKLIRTPEGLAIWLAAKQSFPHAKLSKHVWKHSHPLAAKDLKSVADIMKDAKSQPSQDEFEAQGAASWSANLHFAWDVVLRLLYLSDQQRATKEIGHTGEKAGKSLASFHEFWLSVVDEGLFAKDASTERKQWGMSVWNKVMQEAPPSLLSSTFSKNAMHCLITAQKDNDRYLRKLGQSMLKAFEQRFQALLEDEKHSAVNAACVKAILEATNFANVDHLTKSKMLSRLLAPPSRKALDALFEMLRGLYVAAESDQVRQRHIIDLEGKVLEQAMTHPHHDSGEQTSVAEAVVLRWTELLLTASDLVETTKTLLQHRLTTAFGQAIRRGGTAKKLIHVVVGKAFSDPTMYDHVASRFDKDTWEIVRAAVARRSDFKNPPVTTEVGTGKTDMTSTDTTSVLLDVLLFDVLKGEAEAVEMLQELISVRNRENMTADDLVEMLLSLASRASKFLRLVNVQIFEALTGEVTRQGLESLTKVLLAKENEEGQQEVLESAPQDQEDSAEDDESGSDMEEIDSDVEVVEVSEDNLGGGPEDATSSSGSEPDSNEEEDTEDKSDEEDEQDEDEELAAFDAALASALGTRKLENGEDDAHSSDSDSDMDDDEMMALDEKLAEVFKAREEASGKKKERKETKEAFINFKNRVLDLVEVYLKREQQNPLAIDLILPLLQTIRTTQTKQLADRTSNVLRAFISKCKGKEVPKISKGDIGETLATLKAVHGEACIEASNLHASVASSSSILLVKILVNASVDISQAVDVYGDTRKRQLTDKSCHVQPSFFNDWNNWCTSQTKSQLAK